MVVYHVVYDDSSFNGPTVGLPRAGLVPLRTPHKPHKRRRGVATKLRRLPGTPREALILLGVVRVEWALPNAADMIPPAAADDGRAKLGEWALLRHRHETGHILTEIQS
jgi:hypothetical protein